ncbi:hypothetical protein Anapl_09496 [Anas platyrhynchos]|uniref:Uncharacterized protein n=1 Tax=Anas platyrhynchos TaxID=8839 RepID=R0L083_ANAPL|nr:hypothetical protein Anapl_09496 [Anas platyrhynchos]
MRKGLLLNGLLVALRLTQTLQQAELITQVGVLKGFESILKEDCEEAAAASCLFARKAAAAPIPM